MKAEGTSKLQPEQQSPQWGMVTKIVVALSLIAGASALTIRFRSIIGPILLAFILAYLLHPLARRLLALQWMNWKTSVNLIYLVLIVILGGLFTMSGLVIIQQFQGMVTFIQDYLVQLPDYVQDLSGTVLDIGPIQIDFRQFDLPALTEQIISIVQPALSQLGGFIGKAATSALVTVGWGLFVLVVSYFLLADTKEVPDKVVEINVPGYNHDVQEIIKRLRNIWNTFLRGQLLIILMVILSYIALMMILGVKYAIGVAILAGLARLVPYLGPTTSLSITALVVFFQGGNYFGLSQLVYTLVVLGAALLLDQIYDNLISPRFFGRTLGIHPAGVLVTAIVAYNLLGIVGLILAAPALATVVMLGKYIMRKMFDMEPWPPEDTDDTDGLRWTMIWEKTKQWFSKIVKKKEKNHQ